MKKLLFLLSAILLLGGCAKQTASDTLIVAHKGEMESLDPVYSYDGITHGMLINVYDTLLKFNGSSLTELLPSLATQVPTKQNGLISKDGRTYTFPIRQGVKFHDGRELLDLTHQLRIARHVRHDVGIAERALQPVVFFFDALKLVKHISSACAWIVKNCIIYCGRTLSRRIIHIQMIV